MKQAASWEDKAHRQCWECLKRRLVCDNTLPHCKKCQKSGKECPGYDEQKPLQWVQTGMVTSRRKTKNTPYKIYTAPAPGQDLVRRSSDSRQGLDISSTKDDTDGSFDDLQARFTASRLSNETYMKALPKAKREKYLQKLTVHTMAILQDVDRLFEIGGRAKIEEVVAKQLQNEAAIMLPTDHQPLKKLERMLWVIRAQDVPVYDYLASETSEVVQAVQYYNKKMHPEANASSELAPNPAVVVIPLHVLHFLPPTVHHTFVCLSLNHFIHKLPVGVDRAIIVSNRSKVYHHRGAAIRALSHYVAENKTICSDLIIVSILMFMSMELQNPAFADWRTHTSGLQRLIDMRGGFHSVLRQTPYLSSALVIYMLIVTLANSCSPSWDQIDISGGLENSIEIITEIYSLIFPYTLCPPELFLDVVRTNYLRFKASASLKSCEIDADYMLEGQDLLTHIEAFVPEDWSQPGVLYDEWVLLGTLYQAAAAVYCTVSLQSLTVLPNNLEMNAMRSAHGDRLLASLKAALKSSRIVKFIAWPLVVAGVEAAYRGEGTRNWIEATLTDLSRHLGTSSPLKARSVLKRYWQKGKPGWDECFDRPYVFVM